LKKQGKFDKEAQKIAFEMSYNAVIEVLSDDAKEYLSTIYGDLNAYIVHLIEAEVNRNK
jgi:predicted transcriptional regulator